MSNTSDERAVKGSKFWMQKIANENSLRLQAEDLLDEENLRWFSPLQCESYKEYQLREPKIFSDVLNLSREEFREKFSFWPQNQPHWDALALSNDGRTLYLFEAKAHLRELLSKIRASNPSSTEKITSSLRKVFKETSEPDADFETWTEKYYQLGNRFAFVHFMNRMIFPTIRRVILILLNITDDETYIPVPKEIWARHYAEVFQEMLGKKFPPPNVRVIYFPSAI